jgi:outer membrane protein
MIAAAGASPAGAGDAGAQSRSDADIRSLIEQARTGGGIIAASAGPTVDLSLDDAVQRALERNLDISVERLSPQTFDLSIAAIEAAFRPTLTSTFGQQSRAVLPTSQLVGGDRVVNETLTYNAGVSQALPWGGGNVSVGWNNFRQESSFSFALRNPSYQSTLQLNFTQPLLRGRATDATRSQLRVTRINQEISEVQLRATITNTLAAARNAYWDLVYAVQAVAVARSSLDLANKLVEDNRMRVEIGTMAPIDIVQAQAEAATRRQALAQVEATWRTAELALKRLIVGGTEDELWRAVINPTDRPGFVPEPIDLETAIRNALEARTDLTQVRRQMEGNDVNLRLLRDQTLPAVNLVASYGLQGLGGTQFIRQGTGGPVERTIPGGYADALRSLGAVDFPQWNVAVNISYPIGRSAADANLARARVQLQQTQAQIRSLELQVATEVTNAALQVESNLKRVDASAAARELAERRLEAEESKFEVGMTTNFFVVQAQRDLADAQNVELRAMLDYRKSLVDFERVQQTSLSRGNITLVTGGGGGGTFTGAGGGGTSGGGSGGGTFTGAGGGGGSSGGGGS